MGPLCLGLTVTRQMHTKQLIAIEQWNIYQVWSDGNVDGAFYSGSWELAFNGSTDTTLAVGSNSVYAGLNGTDKTTTLTSTCSITGTIGILGTVGTNSAAAGGSSVIRRLKADDSVALTYDVSLQATGSYQSD